MIWSFFGKRGVSPLIATILLIAFAVALGSVIINWGLELGTDGSSCAAVRLSLDEIGDVDTCYGGTGKNGYINFMLKNSGNIDIIGMSIDLIGEKGVETQNLNSLAFSKSSVFTKSDREVSYDFTTNGRLTEVHYIPRIRSEGKIETCREREAVTQTVGLC